MSKRQSLAIFGSPPLFSRPIPRGQLFFPGWAAYEAMFRDIFEREYYTNHGPLAQELERRLANKLNVRHAMCVTNEFIGLALAGQALGLRGDVVVPAHSSIATSQSLGWAYARPLFCDVDVTGLMTPDLVEPVLAQRSVSAILAVNPWGDACEVQGLQALADQYRIPLYLDSAHGFGCVINDRPVGSFGAIEVISFHAENILGACEGGVICTENDELAARIRNMRSNYGMGPPIPVVKTGNGRMSEAQAAVALFNLEHYPEHQSRNERLFAMYQAALGGIPGMEVRVPRGVSQSNYQNVVCLMDEAAFGLRRDDLWRILCAENITATRGFYPLMQFHDSCMSLREFPQTESYSARTIELPTNQAVTESDVTRLSELIGFIQEKAGTIKRQLMEVV